MRVRFAVLLLALISLISLVAATSAAADCVHVVVPGESLTSIAAADGLSIDQLAAANGLSSTSQLITGSCLTIPPQSGTITPAGTAAPSVTSSTGGDGDNDSDDVGVSAPAPPPPATTGDGDNDSDDVGVSAPAPAAPAATGDGDNDSDDVGATSSVTGSEAAAGGSYVVQPGDTLSGIASRAGMSLNDLAVLNGIDPTAPLLSGTVLKLSSGAQTPSLPQTSSSSGSVATSQPVGAAAQGSAVNPPYPTQQTVTPSQVGSIAAANGVPPALAEAIAYQESGFNNAAVSPADARGVMQILPGTWQYIQNALVSGSPPLAPASATDNVRGGVLLLHSLLNATGGDPAMAAAGYYQGLPSVQANGLYSDTQQYVNSVMSLEHRFGGG